MVKLFMLSFLVLLLIDTGCAQSKNSAALEKYNKQKHRFEIKECVLYYNGEKLQMNTPLEYWEKRFGKNYVQHPVTICYDDQPIILGVDNKLIDGKTVYLVTVLTIKLRSTLTEDLYIKIVPAFNGSILIDGELLNADTDFKRFNAQLKNEKKYPFVLSPGAIYTHDRKYYDEISGCPVKNGNCGVSETIRFNDTNEGHENEVIKFIYAWLSCPENK